MTPNDHRAALFDALMLCEHAWAECQMHPNDARATSAAHREHDAVRDRWHATVAVVLDELERISAERDQSLQLAKVTTEHVERLSLDLQEAQGRAVEQCVTALLGTKDATHNHPAARCAECDAILDEVRPGSHQHPDCPQAQSATVEAWAAIAELTDDARVMDMPLAEAIRAVSVTCQLYRHPLQTCGECNHEEPK